jgi:tetratricopeptide (TPR) repeat protein
VIAALLLAGTLAGPLDEGRDLYRQGRYEDAKRVLLPLANDAQALYFLGMIAYAQEDPEKSADFCSKAVRLNPANADYRYCLGNAYRVLVQQASIFKKPALSKQAREELERAVQIDPRHANARLALIDFYVFAPSVAGGSESKALQHATELRKLDRSEGHRAFARLYVDQKKLDLARKEYLDAVREEPQSARAHAALGAFYGSSDQNYKAAIEELETALRLDPAFLPALLRLGQVAAASGTHLQRGEEALKKYLSAPASDQERSLFAAHYYLGSISEKLGKKSEARQNYGAALKIHAASKQAADALKRVQ